MLLKFWGFTGLASLLASVQFPAGDSDVFVNPQISEARFVSGYCNKQQQTSNLEMILDNFPVIQTDRLDLIEITQFHKPDILSLFGDKNVTRFYNLVPFENEQEAGKLIERFQSRFIEKLGIRWGISLKGQSNIIGTIGFNNFAKQHRANIGYDLQTNHWNNGYISEALSEVIKFGFTKLEINRIEAEVMIGNAISERVLEKLKFKKEGLLRDWMFWNDNHYDMTMYSLLKSDMENKTTNR